MKFDDVSDDVGGFLCLVGVGLFGLWYYWNTPFVLSYRYRTSSDKVFVDKKPHDCEWGTAPLGDKHCSYSAVVTKGKKRSVHLSWEKNND